MPTFKVTSKTSGNTLYVESYDVKKLRQSYPNCWVSVVGED